MLWTNNSADAISLDPWSSADLNQSPDLVQPNSSTVRTIAFVDRTVDDATKVLADVRADVKVFLDPTQDGIAQITQTLNQYQNLTGIDIISHGNIGQIQLGGNILDASTLSRSASQLQRWNAALAPGADILFYGCNVAAGETGKAFVNNLSDLTGADIAASTNLTGNAAQGGDWTLEYATGSIETAPLTDSLIRNYQGILPSLFTTQTPDNLNVTDGTGSAGDYELGMEFQSTKAGTIDAIRYYKSPSETGTHTGRIWSSTGTLLGSVNFTNETGSGWQQQALATPISIAANTKYVVSVNTNSHFVSTINGIASTITNGDLSAVADGSNGVVNATPGSFPIDAYNNTNYFRDVVFTPTPTSTNGSSIFTTQTPDNLNVTDGVGSDGDYELGTEFQSTKAGTIDAIRYYKSPSETGTHIGRIWSSTGTLLGSVNFTNETGSGWQQQALATPISIAANTKYVVSVNTNSHFVSTINGIASTITNGDLSAVADGSNGVVSATPGSFPIDAYNNTNYFRDVVFKPTTTTTNRPGTITVSGTVRQNQTLTANVADPDGLTGVTINYKWQQSGDNGATWSNIDGATSRTLRLSQAQVNKRVRATATYTDALGNAETPLGAATVAVVNVNDAGRVILKGSAAVGGTLSESVVDDDGLTGANINYLWQQSTNGGSTWTNISGANTKSLALTNTLLGRQIRVRTNYTDALGTTETVFSNATTIAAQNAIVVENQKTGTIDWQIDPAVAATTEIAGYGDATSINKGQALNLKISLAQAGRYDLEVYRLGYYGGTGGRLVTSATGLNGVTQAAPTIDPDTRLVEYKWNTSYTLQTGTAWTSGLYLVKLIDSRTGRQTYVEFTLRDDSRPAELGFQEAVTTTAAYNDYGGYSTYSYNSINNQPAYRVSFDRPTSFTASSSLTWEYNMARWLESQGYDVSYYSNLDVHTNPLQLYSQNAFLSVGHDEYWSLEMRNNVEKARDNGTNLGFFSANSAYWRVRFDPSSSGVANRVMTVYKNDWQLDPVAQQDNSKATTLFRSPQVNRPENALLGVLYTGQTDDFVGGYDFVVNNASDPYYAGTGLQNGDKIPRLVGYEWDAVVNNGRTPAGLVILGASPVIPDGGISQVLPPGTNTNISNAVRYTAASGAKVFSTGSIHWAWGLDSDRTPNPRRSAAAQRFTTNVLADFGAKARTPQIFPSDPPLAAPANRSINNGNLFPGIPRLPAGEA